MILLLLWVSLPQDAAVDEAVERGLAWLSAAQNRDGSFGAKFKISKTALSCIAMMAGGSSSTRGRHAYEIAGGLKYLVGRAREHREGLITDASGEGDWRNVHEHGYALLFLGLLYGQDALEPERREELRDVIERAIAIAIRGQGPDGGWGYSLTAAAGAGGGVQDEGSCTVTVVQALHACREAGFAIDPAAIEKGVEYLRKCALESGAFLYSLNPRQEQVVGDYPHYGVTAASVAVLNAAGVHLQSESADAALVARGLAYLKQFQPMGERLVNAFYYYSQFYAAQAFYQAGEEHWQTFWPPVRDHLIATQSGSGAWTKTDPAVSIINGWGLEDEFCGPEYLTACALFVLQVPRAVLPYPQR